MQWLDDKSIFQTTYISFIYVMTKHFVYCWWLLNISWQILFVYYSWWSYSCCNNISDNKSIFLSLLIATARWFNLKILYIQKNIFGHKLCIITLLSCTAYKFQCIACYQKKVNSINYAEGKFKTVITTFMYQFAYHIYLDSFW